MDRNVKVYFLYMLISSFNIFSSFTALILNTKLEISVSTISVLLLVNQITKFSFEVPTGYISDRYGRKISSIIGIGLLLVGYSLLFTQNIALIFVAIIIKAIGMTCISGSFEAMIIEGLPEEFLVKFNALDRVFFYVGYGIACICGGYVIEAFTYQTIIMIDMVFIVLSLVLVLLVKESRQEKVDIEEDEKISMKNVIDFIKSRKILCLFLLMDFITAFSFIAVESFYSLHLTNMGLPTEVVGFIIAGQLIFSSILGFVFHKFIKPSNNTFVIASILHVAFTLMIYFEFIPLFLMPVLYLSGNISYSIYAPIKFELFQSEIKSEYRATIISIKSLLIALAGTSSFTIISILTNYVTLENVTILLLTVTLFVFAIINILLRKYLNQKEADI
ncbi:MAG: hypothetical protein ATN36_01140 [Epulopiscium sp. Nele67-Bin005]|nr:MAG: hypothetical protein ATN36_01140 [Epulopiscium sp. Nele67-Bin005]